MAPQPLYRTLLCTLALFSSSTLATSPQLLDRQATATTTTVALPTGCDGIVPATSTLTDFAWFNSTHNLDCADPGSPDYIASDCEVRDPPLEPAGFGPPDQLNLTGCSAGNPAQYSTALALSSEIGVGVFDCGLGNNVWVNPFFYGDSNIDEGGNATLSYYVFYQLFTVCEGYMRYNATFPLHCSRDAGGNATCTADLPIVATLVAYDESPY